MFLLPDLTTENGGRDVVPLPGRAISGGFGVLHPGSQTPDKGTTATQTPLPGGARATQRGPGGWDGEEEEEEPWAPGHFWEDAVLEMGPPAPAVPSWTGKEMHPRTHPNSQTHKIMSKTDDCFKSPSLVQFGASYIETGNRNNVSHSTGQTQMDPILNPFPKASAENEHKFTYKIISRAPPLVFIEEDGGGERITESLTI